MPRCNQHFNKSKEVITIKTRGQLILRTSRSQAKFKLIIKSFSSLMIKVIQQKMQRLVNLVMNLECTSALMNLFFFLFNQNLGNNN